MAGTEWVHSINAIRPYWWVRSLTGIAMDVGVSLLVYAMGWSIRRETLR